MLNLSRPVISLDFESTGIDPLVDRIVQVGLVKLYPDGRMTEWQTSVNPGVPIPEETSKVHGIWDAFVRHGCVTCKLLKEEHPHGAVRGTEYATEAPACEEFKPVPMFASIAPILYGGLNGCDLLGYNLGHFDVPLLKAEFARVKIAWEPGRILDAFRMAQRVNPRNLAWFVNTYVPADRRKDFKAHDAMHDARQTLFGLLGFFEAHPDFPRDVQKLHDMFFVDPRDANTLDPDGKFAWKGNEAVVNFGKKHKGKTLREVKALDPSFFRDFILKGDFNAVVKRIATDALAGKFPVKS